MAGIGFALRQLTQRDDIIGVVQSYAYSSLVSAGPWIFTILSLSGINIFAGNYVSKEEVAVFRVIIIYNFAFSLVFTGPILLIVTRYLADRIFQRDISEAVGAMMGSLIIALIVVSPIAITFYLFVADLPNEVRILAIWNFLLVAGIWMANVFISALKDYNSVTRAFGFGMVVACGATYFASQNHDLVGMLVGFNVGLSVILFTLIARVFAEYPYLIKQPFGFLRYFVRYWDLAAIGFISSVALWVDKWVMWWAPERESIAGMIYYSNYDSAMFLAYLTTVPSLALFMISVETRFFTNYQRYYSNMQQHCSLKKINANHKQIILDIIGGLRNVLVLQGAITILTITAAPRIFDLLDINYLQLGIFRFGVLGAFFHMLIQFLAIFLAYFDLRRVLLSMHLIFLVCNAGFTWLSMQSGFSYYGYGFFIAALITMIFTYAAFFYNISRLPYLTFIKTNPSIKN